MPHKQIIGRWHIVTETKTVHGMVQDVVILEGFQLPWRILKRRSRAYDMGLQYVRSLGNDGQVPAGGVVAVTVSDGKRALASWRRMPHLSGYTGTHDVHPLIAEQLQ